MKTKKTKKTKGAAIAIYHVVYAHETFEQTAETLLNLVRKAQETDPGAPRMLYLDIEGHRNDVGGFDADMLELQKEFVLGFLMPFLSKATSPLISAQNTKGQRNDVSAALAIKSANEAVH